MGKRPSPDQRDRIGRRKECRFRRRHICRLFRAASVGNRGKPGRAVRVWEQVRIGRGAALELGVAHVQHTGRPGRAARAHDGRGE